MKITHTQNKQILNHLKRKRGLTALDALHHYGCMRLGARIFELREAGHCINSDRVKRGDRHVSFYSLAKY